MPVQCDSETDGVCTLGVSQEALMDSMHDAGGRDPERGLVPTSVGDAAMVNSPASPKKGIPTLEKSEESEPVAGPLQSVFPFLGLVSCVFLMETCSNKVS